MNTEKSKIRVLLVDDQPLFVHSLAQVIQHRADDIEIIGIESNGRDAVAAVEQQEIDIIIMDIKMPIMNGVEATRRISEIDPQIRIMMLTTFDEDAYVVEALQYGAKGYLLKTILPEEVITAIRALYAGINQISPSIITRLTDKMRLPAEDSLVPAANVRTAALPSWFIELTRLEKEILEQVVQGLSNKEIASLLNLAEQTVKNYLTNIYGKMDVHKRSQLVLKYMEDHIAEYR
jgi:DNA-binding NarL/FixJ family response regulator